MNKYKVGAISSLFKSSNEGNKDDKLTDPQEINEFNSENETVVPQTSEKIVARKDKPKLAGVEEKDKTMTKRKLIAQRKSENQQNAEKTVFIGNAPFATKRREIQKLFKRFGEIESVYERSLLQKNEKLTKKMMSTDKTKKIERNLTTVNFFVRFREKEAAETASKEMNGFAMGDNNLRVNLSMKAEFPISHTLFVGNLPFEASEQDVRTFFAEKCGEVESVRLIRDKATGRSTGVAYVSFKDRAMVIVAVGLTDVELMGRQLRISRTIKKNKRPAGNKSNYITGRKGAKLNTRQQSKKITKKKKDLKDTIAEFSTFDKNDMETTKSGVKLARKKIPKSVRKDIKKRKKKGSTKSIMN